MTFAAASKAAKVQTIRNGDFYGTGYLQGGQRPPLAYAISLIEGKWKMHILFWLWKAEVLRYSELKRALGAVTHKMLSSQLKELERDGIILRTEYPQVPPKVEYSLSETGKTLMPILAAFCQWGHAHMPADWTP